MDAQKFISDVSPAAISSEAKTAIPASFVIAEAALESGWGDCAPGFNLFGVKADSSWTGNVTVQRTREFLHGHWVLIEAKFRAYSGWLESIEDHAKFLTTNARYKAAFAFRDGASFAQAVAKAGYATDPTYAAKIISIIREHGLALFDVKASH